MSNRRRLRPQGRRRDPLEGWPCPWCPSDVVIDTVDATWDLFAVKPDADLAFDALGAWHCHGCGAAGLVMPQAVR